MTENFFRELSPELQKWIMEDEYVRKAFFTAFLLELKKLQATDRHTQLIC